MKIKLQILFSTIIALSICLNACKDSSETSEKNTTNPELAKEQTKNDSLTNNQTKKEEDISARLTSKLRPSEKIEFGKSYTDTISFISFDDNYDHWYFLAEKNKDTITIIYNDESIHKLVQGERIAIEWEMKNLQEAGDPEITYTRLFLISFKKINAEKHHSSAPKSSSFVISCGSGCAMTYSEHQVVSNPDSNTVTFKVEMFVNEQLSDEYYEAYIYTCDASVDKTMIKLEGTKNFSIEILHEDMQEKLKSYASRFCKK